MTSLAIPIFASVTAIALIISVRSVRNLEREFLSTVIFAGYGIIFGLAPIFLHWQGAPRMTTAAFASLLGLMGLAFGRAAARHHFGPPQPLNLGALSGNGRVRLITMSTFLGLLGIFLFAYGTAGSFSAFVASSRFEFRLSAANPLLKNIGSYLIPFVDIPVALLVISHSRTQRVIGLLGGFVLAISLFTFMKGARSGAIGLILTLLILWLCYRSPGHAVRSEAPYNRRGRLRIVSGALLIGCAVAFLLPSLYQVRKSLGSGYVSPISVATISTGPTRQSGFFQQDPLNYSNITLSVVDKFPSVHGFVWLYPLRRVLFFPLPSGGIKPSDTNKVVARTLGSGDNETTVPPSLPGEGYIAAGGLLGVLPWVALYGFALGAIEARMSRRVIAITIIPVGLTSTLLALRGQLYEITLTLFVTTALVILVSRLAFHNSPAPSAGPVVK